jgi:zinc/manganese transport system permease protein
MLMADVIVPSWDLLADLQLLFALHFMRNAYLAGTLVAIAAGLMGYFMVLRAESFAGHSLANVGFAGAAGAALVGLPALAGLFTAGIIAALGIHLLGRDRQRNDVAVGAVFTAALALGYLFIHLATTEYAANIYNTLFGNIVGISDGDVTVITWTCLLIMAALVLLGRPLLFSSLDPDVAAARGVPVRWLALAYLILLALLVAVAVQVVGVLLIFALLVTPAAIAQQLSARPPVALALAVALALIFVWLGLAIAYFTPYPAGFYITTLAFATYVVVRVGRLLPQRIRALAAWRGAA